MKKNGTPKSISPNIVRAWLDSVLNPLYNGMLEVNELLKDDNYTWDWGYRDFTDIKPFSNYFDYRVYPNYEQLHMTEFKKLLDINVDYDQKRTDLNNSCCKLFDLLIDSDELQKLIDTKINKFESSNQISSEDANYFRKNDSIKWISTYVINNQRTLSYSHIFKKIWNNESDDFFGILETEAFKDIKYQYDLNSRLFKQSVSVAISCIKNKSNELSLKYGVPIVAYPL